MLAQNALCRENNSSHNLRDQVYGAMLIWHAKKKFEGLVMSLQYWAQNSQRIYTLFHNILQRIYVLILFYFSMFFLSAFSPLIFFCYYY